MVDSSYSENERLISGKGEREKKKEKKRQSRHIIYGNSQLILE